MLGSISVRLPVDLQEQLEAVSQEENIPVSDIVRESLSRYLSIKRFRKLRKLALPFAESQGILTDEDIFRHIK